MFFLSKPQKRNIGSKTSDFMLIRYAEDSVGYRFFILISDVIDWILLRKRVLNFFKHVFSLVDQFSHAPVEWNHKNSFDIEELWRSKRPWKENFSYGNDF